jgi:hypothetical protein
MLNKLSFYCAMLLAVPVFAQDAPTEENPNAGRFSLGYRTTVSAFSDIGYYGFGSGGQFRIQLGPKLNSEWYYDHISTDLGGLGRRTDEHIGWSVMYYAFGQHLEQGKFTPFFEAGNCFDYTAVRTSYAGGVVDSRGSAAVHLGMGTHISLSQRADITFKVQYMLHLGTGIETKIVTDEVTHASVLQITRGNAGLDGHLLMTCSVNFYVFRLWKGYLFGNKSKGL